MSEPLTDQVLRERALGVLERELGATETLRFVAMISRQPLDYQQWREKHFEGMTLKEILAKATP